MASGSHEPVAFGLFAELLAYPRAGILERARLCHEGLRERSPDAAAHLAAFVEWAEGAREGQVEEVYTGTFDLDPSCYPYLGYHLFGESYKRSLFLVELRTRYKELGFEDGGELPDHLAVVLSFLSSHPDDELARDLLEDALVPALDKVLQPGQPSEDEPPHEADPGYLHVLRALKILLSDGLPAEDASLEPISVHA